MIKIYNSILDIKENFDAFIFDIQGVLWSGHNFYEGVQDTLKKLIENEKIVFVLSNSARFCKDLSSAYLKLNFLKETHYNEFITCGDFTKEILLKKELQFKNNKNPKNCYIFGEETSLFDGTDFNVVKDIKKADFVYISNIALSDDYYNNTSNDNKKYFVKLLAKPNGLWRITNIKPIIPYLETIIKTNLPILINNPDFVAMNNIVGSDKKVATLTPGSVGKYLKEKGLEVIEFGKPYKEIFEYAILKIQEYRNIDKSRICMIGDTLRTDIKGANDAGIKSVLCLETGITKNEIDNGAELENLVKNEGVVVDYLVKSVNGSF